MPPRPATSPGTAPHPAAAPLPPATGPVRPSGPATGATRATAPAPGASDPTPAGSGRAPTAPLPAPVRPSRPPAAPYGHPRPTAAHIHGAHAAPGPHPHAARTPFPLPPEAPVETTTRLRPVRERSVGRLVAVAVCAVLGVGLIGGALAGTWLAAAEPGAPAEPPGYAEAKELWHNAPVDNLFPRTLVGSAGGPGGAGRTWTRIVVAPDAACSPAVLAKGLLATLRPLGCERVLRATYTDATASSVITVGLVFTRADAAAQRTLGPGLTTRLGADVPPALAGPGTVAARFGAPQRASWWLAAPADLPVVVTAVSGFADGRPVDRPQPAEAAMAKGRTDAVAQSGLGHEAKGITLRLEQQLRATVAAMTERENAR
ncbi:MULTISPECIES: hypothetical protein [unclassified Streptomyces]|uniref:hypothetical protein n=1 Tax=unclassified Streptomyces TaxID=2593676 RepID=UPI002412B692|nr:MULTISPECIES: hypothetical protein [unclassified Streptomyces]